MEGFLYKDLIEELFIVMDSFCIFPTCSICNFLIDFNFFLLFKGTV